MVIGDVKIDRDKSFMAFCKQGKSFTSLLNYRSVFNALGDNVKTNMTFDEMVDVQKNYRDAADKIEQLRFEKGTGKRMNGGVWYYMMDEEELQEITIR